MIHVITGAPCSGKSTYVQANKQPGDVVVDYDLLARALGSEVAHGSEGAVREATFKARNAVINWLLKNYEDVNGWIIHTSPAEWQLSEYEKAGAEIITLDTDMQTCLERAEMDNRPEGEAQAIIDWFSNNEKKGFALKKSFDVTVEAKDGGRVRAYASTFDREPDSYGDVIHPKAFDKTLEKWRELGKPIPLLWGHDTSDPFSNIGGCVNFGTDERGLWYEAEFDEENPKAQYVRKLAQEGRVYQCSFAFSCTDSGEVKLDDGTRVNELRELDLYEISIVQIPANQHATIEEAKGTNVNEKIGKRNSKADEDMLREALATLKEIEERIDVAKEIISGVIAVDDNEPEPEPEVEPEEQDVEGEEPKQCAEVVELYKETIKELF